MALFRNDPDLLFHFRKGHPSALSHVYQRYAPRVEAHVRALARTTGDSQLSQRTVIADIVQETFIRAFSERARLAYEEGRDYAPYLLSIARNCFFDVRRAKAREVLKAPEELRSRMDTMTHQSQADCEPKLNAALAKYLRGLPTPLFGVLEQRVLLGRSQEAACAALGLSRGKLRTGEQQLRHLLKRQLVADGLALAELRA